MSRRRLEAVLFRMHKMAASELHPQYVAAIDGAVAGMRWWKAQHKGPAPIVRLPPAMYMLAACPRDVPAMLGNDAARELCDASDLGCHIAAGKGPATVTMFRIALDVVRIGHTLASLDELGIDVLHMQGGGES